MTTPTVLHEPVVAFGKTNEKTGVVATVTEGSKTFTISNASNVINVDDLVLCSDQDDADIQFLGEVLTSNATTITTSLGLQNAPGTSLKIWVPTTSVRFLFGEASGGQRQTDDDGTSLVETRGNTALSVQSQDSSLTIDLSFNPVQQGDYQLWRTFRQINRTFGTDPMSLIYFDNVRQISRVDEVRLRGGVHTVTQLGRNPIDAFSESFFVVNSDTYVSA